MSDDNDHDEIADLADRIEARRKRGEDWELEFMVEFGALTKAEQEEFMTLMEQRIAHSGEKLEARQADMRCLKALADLLQDQAPGMTLWEAGEAGQVRVQDVISAIRSAA